MRTCWLRFARICGSVRVAAPGNYRSQREWSIGTPLKQLRSKTLLLFGSALMLVLCSVSAPAGDVSSRPSPTIGNFTQSFTWPEVDENIPLLLGNGDTGGLFDPFGGTTYDELRFGSGSQRDIRTLLLTQVMVPDYWVLEDQSAHFFDPRYYHPTVPRRYLTLGSPFSLLLRPTDGD